MNPSELFLFLEKIGASPKKGLSQNFLIDSNIVRKIVRTASVQPGDSILEIGPGPGALTQELLQAGARVFAIEKDPLFAKELSRFQTPDQRLRVFCEDALDFPLETLPVQKAVANLPYHITTPLLEKLILSEISSMTVMVQKEFGKRLFAQPKTKDFSSFTVFARFYTNPIAAFHVPPTCFFPEPSVDSSVVHLERREAPPVAVLPFFQLVRTAFGKRRKMLSTSLKELYPSELIRTCLTQLGLRSDERPEGLSLEEWVLLFNEIRVATSA